MDLSRREFLAGCAGCALAMNAAGCAAVNPVPLVDMNPQGVVPMTGLLRKPGDQIKVRVAGSPDLVLVWTTGKGFGAASIACTHRGSEVHFNATDGTLDCPSHGSRFDQNGKVIQGPAKQPLVSWRVQVEDTLLRLTRS